MSKEIKNDGWKSEITIKKLIFEGEKLLSNGGIIWCKYYLGKLQPRYQIFRLLANVTQTFHLCHRRYQTFTKFAIQAQIDGCR